MTGNGDIIIDISDDPLDTTDVDVDGDGDAEDVTVVTIDPIDPPEEDEIVVFTGISPNGDGVNDFWVIQGIDNFPNNTVRLFNRWGVEVFSEKGYAQDDKFFRGLSNGRRTIDRDAMLPVGTYYYAIEYVNDENKTIQLGGYIYITR
jgi:gliding motility-associated-like protein